MTEYAKRDQWGRPLIVPPGGGKLVAYTRVTTVAKTLDDTSSLERWACRMTALGLVARKDILALVSATKPDDRKALDKLCDDAKEAAKAGAGANLGTALHALTEQIDRGEEVLALDGLKPDLDAYRAAMGRQGFIITPEAVERMVVLDEWRVAGTADRLPLVLPDGRIVVGDLKTTKSTSLPYSWHSIAVQLAAYANADAMYDMETGEREPMPSGLSREVGIVIHLPVGEGVCTLYEVDLVAGWEAFRQSMWTRTWRKADVSRIFVAVELSPTAPAAPEAEEIPPSSASPERRQWIIERIRALPKPGLDALARRWPDGIPTLKDHDAHTDAQLDAIVAALNQAETDVEAPFPPADPTPIMQDSPRLSVAVANHPANGDEGGPVDLEALDGFRQAYEGFDPAIRQTVESWAQACYRDGARSLNLRQKATRWRWSVLCALLVAARAGCDDASLKDLIVGATGDEACLMPGVPMGAVLAGLTIDEADRVAHLARHLGTDALILTFREDGAPSFSGPAYQPPPAA